MIYVTFQKDGIEMGGGLLARYQKQFSQERKTETNNNVENFLILVKKKNGEEEILELPQENVFCMTLNFVPEMINKSRIEFKNSEKEEESWIIIKDFYGFPYVAENKDFFVEPLDQNRCLELLKNKPY